MNSPTSPSKLADCISALAAGALTDIDDAHDFFAYTKALWRLAEINAKRGKRLTLRNRVTQSTITAQNLPDLAQKYADRYMASACLQRLLSVFEEFFFAFLREHYVADPSSLTEKQLTLAHVLRHSSTDGVIRDVVDRHLRNLAYQRIEDWFKVLERITGIGIPDSSVIGMLKEAKASRDVDVHNRGIVGSDYVTRCGNQARYAVGDPLEISERYLRDVHGVIRSTIEHLANSATSRLHT